MAGGAARGGCAVRPGAGAGRGLLGPAGAGARDAGRGLPPDRWRAPDGAEPAHAGDDSFPSAAPGGGRRGAGAEVAGRLAAVRVRVQGSVRTSEPIRITIRVTN